MHFNIIEYINIIYCILERVKLNENDESWWDWKIRYKKVLNNSSFIITKFGSVA